MYLLNYPISRFLASKTAFLTSSSAPLCTIGVGFELTVNFVAQIFDGNGSLCIFGVVHDWICLIGSLVVQCGQLT